MISNITGFHDIIETKKSLRILQPFPFTTCITYITHQHVRYAFMYIYFYLRCRFKQIKD